MVICDEKDCFGCALCQEICPKKAIRIDHGKGFFRPVIDNETCIKCGICHAMCPSNKMDIFVPFQEQIDEVKCYAAWNKDIKKHFMASSGGIARELARTFIEAGWFVVGVTFNADKLEAEHRIFETTKDLDKMANSLYVQSNKTDIYQYVKNAIRKKPGIFFGIPCEIFAFKEFYKNLSDTKKDAIFVDLLCRGGASPFCLKEHLSYICDRRKIDKVSFRGGINDCRLTVYNKNGKVIYQGEQLKDPYFKNFMRHSIYQKKCYSCPFAGKKRCGDITLGDFWGVDEKVLQKAGGVKRGISLVLINSNVGEEAFKVIENNIIKIERPLYEAIEGNSTLQSPTEMVFEYDLLWEEINKLGFINAFENVYHEDFSEVCKSWKKSYYLNILYNFLNKCKEKFPYMYIVWKRLKNKS